MANGISSEVRGCAELKAQSPVEKKEVEWYEEISDGTNSCTVKAESCGGTTVFKLEDSGCDFRLSALICGDKQVDLPVTNIVLLQKNVAIFALKDPSSPSGVSTVFLETEKTDGKRTLIEDGMRFFYYNEREKTVSALQNPWPKQFIESR